MTDLTKLADALEDIADSNSDLVTLERDSAREAARILRSAAGVDVAGLMALHDAHGSARWETGYNEAIKAKAAATQSDKAAQKARAALESALRVALAGREPDKLDAQIHDSSSTRVYATVEAACWGEYTIDASRDDESRNWYITVTAPSGRRDYDGYWRNSDFKTADDVVNEAIRGACLTGLAAAQPGAQEPAK